jgi:CDP-glucose 4,6-dehydratase
MTGDLLKQLKGPVFLTGHTGFKGTWMTLLLKKMGIQVVGFSLMPEKDSLFQTMGLQGGRDEFFGDVTNRSQLESFINKTRPSVIIHFAAQSLVLRSYQKPLATFETNVIGTANILDICSKLDFVKAIGIATTDKVYKNDNDKRFFVETDPLSGEDPYSASKVATESVITAWKTLNQGKPGPLINVFRTGNVIGGGDLAENRVVPDLIKSAILNKPAIIRNPTSTRPWLHVLDPLRGYIQAIEFSIKNSEELTLNFGPTELSLEVIEIAKLASKFWDRVTFEVEENSKFFEAKSINLNTTQAKKFIDWSPSWSQPKSIEKTINWWKAVVDTNLDMKSACDADIEEILNLI